MCLGGRAIFQEAVEPFKNYLEPLDPMFRSPTSRKLMTFSREPHELHLFAKHLQGDEQLFSLLDGAAQIVL